VITARGLAAWCGTDRLSAVAPLARRAAEGPLTPASALSAFLVAGRDVPVRMLPKLDPRLVEVRGDLAHARVAVLPLGPSLLVCDRLDAPASRDLVCWPDDSSYHLARSLPPQWSSWLDIGCGSAFAPLLLGGPAHGVDINPRALEHARLGGELSNVPLTLTRDWPGGPSALISCNAPIPGIEGPVWRATTLAFFDELYRYIPAHLAPGGLAVIHAAEDALAPLAELPGDRIVVGYTPEPGFAVAWWAPDGPSRYVTARRLLTADRPHLTYEDRAAALC
jgi:hypothetical protein